MPLGKISVCFMLYAMSTGWMTLGLVKLVPILSSNEPASDMLVAGVAILELAVGIALFFPATRIFAIRTSLALAAVFLVLNLFPNELMTRFDTDCGCLGPGVDVQRSSRRAVAGGLVLCSWFWLGHWGRRRDLELHRSGVGHQ